jgi:hypothetical protein
MTVNFEGGRYSAGQKINFDLHSHIRDGAFFNITRATGDNFVPAGVSVYFDGNYQYYIKLTGNEYSAGSVVVREGSWGSGSLYYNLIPGVPTNTSTPGGTLVFDSTNSTYYDQTEIFADESSGNIGIGTVTPSAKLHIAGDVSASVYTSSVVNGIGFRGTASYAIGTNFCNTSLYASQSQWSVSASFASSSATASFVSNAFVQGGNSFGTTALLGTNDNNRVNIEVSGSVVMTLSGSRVGIGGVVSPVSTLHVGGDMYLAGGESQNAFVVYSAANDYNFIRVDGDQQKIVFSETLGGDASGVYVGIGTATPTAMLDVVGLIKGTAITASRLFGTSSWADNSTTASSLVSTNNYSLTNLTASGNISASGIGIFDAIGVGTSVPNYTLDVAGTMRVSGGIVDAGAAAQWMLNGGGTVTWNGTHLLWSTRVISIPVEKTEFGSAGYIDIDCPISGTIVYYDGTNTTTTATCTANGVPVSSWEALYYEVTPGQSSPSVQTKFRLVNFQNSTWRPDSNWLLICTRNGDGTDQLKWLPGQINIPGTGGIYYSDTGLNDWELNGTGTSNYVPKFTDLNTIGNSQIYDTDTNVGIGTTTPQSLLHVFGHISASSFGSGTFHGSASFANRSTVANTSLYASQSQWAVSSSFASSSLSSSYSLFAQFASSSLSCSYASRSLSSSYSLSSLSSSYSLSSSFVSNAFVQNGNSFGTTATLGTNDSSSLVFRTQATTRMTLTAAGGVGINTTPTTTNLTSIYGIHTVAASTSSLVVSTVQSSTGTGSSANDNGIYNTYSVAGTNNVLGISPQCNGLFNAYDISTSGTTTGSYRALRNNMTIGGAVTMSADSAVINALFLTQWNAYSGRAKIPNFYQLQIGMNGSATVSGSIDALFGIFASGPNTFTGSAFSITNTYGCYLESQMLTGVSRNTYGLYQNGTTDYNIFRGKTTFASTISASSAVGVASNVAIGTGFFSGSAPAGGLAVEGSVGVGILTPTYKLEINNGGIGVDRSPSGGGSALRPILSAKASGSSAPYNDLISLQASATVSQSNMIIGFSSVGQSVYLGAGESPGLAANISGWGDESLYLGADEGLKVITNLQGSLSGSYIPFSISPDGAVRIHYRMTGSSYSAPSNNFTLAVSGSNTQGLMYVGSPLAPNAFFVSGSGNVGVGSTTPTVRLDVSGSTAINVGTAGGSGNFSLDVNKNGTAQLQVRGDGYVGIGAAPSTNGWVQITAINTSTPHFSLSNGVTNSNASSTYTFRGWWAIYFNSPVFNAGASQQYFVPIYS